MEYRQERKFICSEGQLAIMQMRLKPLMQPDPHMPSIEGYRIRSVYFDDNRDSCLEENLAGVDARTKYRLRLYNASDALVRLEIKQKLHGLTKKQGCSLTREQAAALLQGNCPMVTENDPQPLRQLFLAMRTEGMRPKVVVDYQRYAYIHPVGNVRVTFDRQIGCSSKVEEFLNPTMAFAPLLPPGQHILEVKYDELIPDWLLQAMELGQLMQNTFSKYAAARQANL